jgi:tagatose 1,6-diphosphate aldolase
MPFQFFDPGPLIDGDLELIPPDERWIDEVLRTCAHPAGRLDPSAKVTRQQIEDYLRAAPGGRYMPGPKESRVPQYQFWMRLREAFNPPVVIAGAIGLRIGDNEDLRLHLGHVGYNVYPAAQGHHYAARACKLLFPLARKHGMRELWITCNPENTASRRTCQHLGAAFVGTVPLPKNHLLYQRGERHKCRYRIDLNAAASGW